MKRKVWQFMILFVAILLLVACGESAIQTESTSNDEDTSSETTSDDSEDMEETDEDMEEDAAPVSTEPIKIGFLAALSSVAAQSAQDMVDGFTLYWEQNNYEVAGRTVEVIVEDTAGDPDTALNKARLLVEQENVDMLFGTLFANEGLAVADYVAQTGTPTFFATSSADDLTQRTPVTNLLRPAGWSSSGPHHAFGEWVYNNTECTEIYTIGSDYAFGHEVIGGFVNTFTDEGGSVADQVWNPVAEADFSSYLGTILDAEPECVFVLEVGAAAVRFHSAWSDFGLEDAGIQMFMGEVPADQSILRGIDPPEIAVGQISIGHYAEGLDNPATKAFLDAYDERYGNLASYYAVGQFTAAQWVAAAIEDLNGDISDSEALLDAVRGIELSDTPLGPLRLDDFGNPVQNMYVRQVELREDGRLWNVVIDTIPNVSQFYNYDVDEFLAQPVYSRDYQGIDWNPETEAGANDVAPAPVSTEPIKIGFLAALSSVAAQSAQDMVDGFTLYWEQNNYEVAGRPVEVIVEDTAGDPDTALNKARLLVEQENVDMLFGTLFANEGLAVADYVAQTGTPTFFATSSADDLTQRTPVTNLLRPAGWSSSGPHHAFGDWVAQNGDCDNVYTIGSDYAFGHEVIGGFVNTYTDGGGTVTEQVWNPVAEADFSSYLSTILVAEPDCVFALEVGAAAVRFHQSWNDFGLADTDIDLYLGEVPADQSILRGIDPPEIAVGRISVGHYAEGLDNPATQAFLEAYDERYGNLASYYAVGQYTAAQWVAAAIVSLNGDISDSEALLDAVRAIELTDTPLGPLRLDDFGNPVQNMYIRQVELRDDGRLWNVVIDTIPDVSQFYNYDVDAFLEQPVYSRDYQGIEWP